MYFYSYVIHSISFQFKKRIEAIAADRGRMKCYETENTME